jgi:Mrp family chromosome partitioning ATPase/capsular polysaccharide biosynthesis protein
VATQQAGIDVKRLTAIARRHVLMIVALTLVFGAGAYAYSSSQTPMYEASALILYESQLDINNPLGQDYSDRNTRELELQSAVTRVTGPDIRKSVHEILGVDSSKPPFSVTATVASSDVSASSDSVNNGVRVSVTSPDAEWSMRLANAYAEEFVYWRIDRQKEQIEAARQVIEQKLNDYQTPAELASSDYAILKERLSDLEILAETVTGNFAVAVPATEPSAPYAPQPRRAAAMGAAFGLLLGIALAFVREKLDTRLRSHREVREIMGLPIIGRVGRIPSDALAKGPLVVVSEANGRAAESLRVLRSNLEFAFLGEKNRVLMVMSAQQGEGKSLTTANLAASLTLAGKKVVLVDADLRRPRIHTLFKAKNASGVSSVIAGLTDLDQALQTIDLLGRTTPRTRGDGRRPAKQTDDTFGADARLSLLTAGPIPPNPGEMVASRRFAAMIEELGAMKFDYVLIDSPAFLPVGDAAALAGVADAIILVVNLKMTRKPMLEDAREFLAPLPAAKLGVVTVMDSSGKNERYHYYEGSA